MIGRDKYSGFNLNLILREDKIFVTDTQGGIVVININYSGFNLDMRKFLKVLCFHV